MTSVRETHPYNLRETIPDGTHLLIVGTAPPPRFSNPRCKGMRPCDFDFFYGSEDNYMWKFLDNIAKEVDGQKLFSKEASSEECCHAARDFLRRHKLWMCDILQSYQRKPNKECSPLDQDIIVPEITDCTDFRSIFATHTCLTTVVFTSEKAAEWTIKVLDNQALRETYITALSRRKAHEHDLAIEEYVVSKSKQPLFRASMGDREIEFFILPSPTGRSRRKGLTTRLKQDIYKQILLSR